jgi:hypothetical protein
MNPQEGRWEPSRRRGRKNCANGLMDGDSRLLIVRECWAWHKKRGRSAWRTAAPQEGKEQPAVIQDARRCGDRRCACLHSTRLGQEGNWNYGWRNNWRLGNGEDGCGGAVGRRTERTRPLGSCLGAWGLGRIRWRRRGRECRSCRPGRCWLCRVGIRCPGWFCAGSRVPFPAGQVRAYNVEEGLFLRRCL